MDNNKVFNNILNTLELIGLKRNLELSETPINERIVRLDRETESEIKLSLPSRNVCNYATTLGVLHEGKIYIVKWRLDWPVTARLKDREFYIVCLDEITWRDDCSFLIGMNILVKYDELNWRGKEALDNFLRREQK
jgi:hypothetical protein